MLHQGHGLAVDAHARPGAERPAPPRRGRHRRLRHARRRGRRRHGPRLELRRRATCTTSSCCRRSRSGAASRRANCASSSSSRSRSTGSASTTASSTRQPGRIEEGYVDVADMVARQPWLDDDDPRSRSARPTAAPTRPARTRRRPHDVTRSSSAPAPTGWPRPSPWPRPGVEVTVLEAADEIGGGTRSSELTVPGAAARPLLGRPPDGRRLAVPALARPGAARPGVALARGRSRAPARRRAGRA